MTKTVKEIFYENLLETLVLDSPEYKEIQTKLRNLRRGKSFRYKQKYRIELLNRIIEDKNAIIDRLENEVDELKIKLKALEVHKFNLFFQDNINL
jgi:hypothetical protein